jgi:hypothetical protein
MGHASGRAVNERRSPFAWICIVAGTGTMVFGIIGLLDSTSWAAARSVALWVVGADLLHDLLIAPVVCALGFVIARWTSAAWRWPVRAAALTSAFVIALAYPALRGFGRDRVPDNRSVLPLDYPTAVATVLGLVWIAALLWGIVSWRRRRSLARPDHDR